MLAPGEEVERYRIERLLGVGGMSEVYLARHATLGTVHAVKVLTLSGPAIQRRLVEEGRIQARLRHPNLVHVSDVLTAKGLPALVMEYVDGPDLAKWIAERRPSPEAAEAVFRSIVAGVAAAHEAGVVHRDLKPANIFVATDSDGGLVPKIGDFGLVKALASEEAGHTRAGLPMGTPQYMPPEQIRDAASVDQRADVFALGCVLYELLAHHQAYGGTDVVEIFLRITEGRRDPLPGHVPARLAAIVERCLRLEPSDRPADGAALLAALDAAEVPRAALPPHAPVVALALLGSLATVGFATVAIALAVTWVGTPAAPAEVAPCAGDWSGLAPVPPVFEKPEGSIWTLSEGVVVTTGGDPPAPVCSLPAGAQVKVAKAETRGGEAFLKVDASRVVTSPAASAEEPDGEVAGRRCEGRDGELLGWLHTKPEGARRPQKGGTWKLSFARYAFAEFPDRSNGDTRGPIVCALPSGAELEIRGEPVKVGLLGRSFWVPVYGGSVR